jgi:hypothetical protein
MQPFRKSLTRINFPKISSSLFSRAIFILLTIPPDFDPKFIMASGTVNSPTGTPKTKILFQGLHSILIPRPSSGRDINPQNVPALYGYTPIGHPKRTLKVFDQFVIFREGPLLYESEFLIVGIVAHFVLRTIMYPA